MLAIVKRILDLAGSFSASSRRSLVVGMACNVLKALFMAGMLAAVWWALENRDRLGAEGALQCFGMLALSVAGQFAFQYLVDIKMDAEGFHVFRDLRLRVGDRLKGAPMGYFSEQRLSAITTTLTTTVHQLEEFMTICLTGLSGGVAMAVIMSLFFLAFAPPVAAVTFAGIAVGLVVLEWLRRRSTSVTREVTAAQEDMADAVIEYARGMAVLRTFASPDEALAKAKASFERKRKADFEQEQAAQGVLKLYALVFNLASCGVLLASCALYLAGALPLSWALTLLVAAFMIYGELISANNGAFLTKKIEGELDRIALRHGTLAEALDAFSREGIRSIADCEARIAAMEAGGDYVSMERLAEYRDYAVEKGILPQHSAGKRRRVAPDDGRATAKRGPRGGAARQHPSTQGGRNRDERGR